MAKLGDLVVRIGANTKGFNAKLGTLKSQIRKDTKNIAAMGRNMSMGITAPLVAIGATSFKVAADFEQSMAKVKAVSGATGDEFKKLQDNAKELGRTTRFTASEVSALQLEYAKLGFSADEITQVTGATLNLAQATGSDLAQSAEVAGATLRAFGLNASETERVTDVMAASFSSSALDINSFQDAMKFVAPVAKAAGVSLEEATAMLGQLANNGIKGSNAGTSLRRILQEVAGTGQPFSEAMKKSADEVINLADAKDEVGRTASSAFLVLKEGMGDVAGLTTELQHAEGAAAGMAAIMDDTAEGAMKRMQSAVEGAQIEIGAALAPTMIKLANIVGDLATRFSEMSDGGQLVIMAVSGIAAAIGPVLYMLPNVAQGFNIAKIALKSLNATALANPYVAVAAAVISLAGAFYLLSKRQNSTQKAQSQLNAIQRKADDLYAEEASELELLRFQYREAAGDLDKRKELLLKMQQIAPDTLGDLDAEKTSYEDLSVAVDGYLGTLKKQIALDLGKEELTAALEEQIKLEREAERLALDRQKLTLAAEKAEKKFNETKKTGTRYEIFRAKGAMINARAELSAGQSLSRQQNESNQAIEDQKALVAALEGEYLQLTATILENNNAAAGGGGGGSTREMPDAKNGANLQAEAFEKLGTTLEDVLEPIKKPESFTVNLELGEIEEFDMGEEIFGDEESFAAAGDVIIKKLDEIKEKSEMVMARASTLGDSLGATFANLRNQGTEIKMALESGLITPLEAMEQKSESSKNAIRSLARDGIMALINLAKMNVIANATSPANAGNLLSGGLATPAFIVAGLSMLEGFLGGMTAFADGGIVSGPTMGLVGEYPGAKTNPEVIAPLDKLRSMMGGQNVVVTGRLSGRDILLSSEMSNIDRNRVRGY